MELVIPDRLAILGHPQRLAVFRLLMRRYPDEVPATEVAQALGLKPNTLSTYLNALRSVGLVTQTRAGTSLRYAIDMQNARHTIDALVMDCCRGRPEICGAAAPIRLMDQTPDRQRKFRVLFLCTGNSARSIFAEALVKKYQASRFDAFSAGTDPRTVPHPLALSILRQNGHDTSHLQSKSLSVFQSPDTAPFDFVFTVCNRAANEDCPVWPGHPVTAHWGVPDPASAEGSDAEKTLAFHSAYDALYHRIKAFTALPFDTLDRLSLQHALDQIGQGDQGESP